MPDAAGLQHIGPIGNRQRERRHLIDKKDGRSLLAQLREQAIQRFQKSWRKPERRLVEHQNLGARHQAAGDRQHLLLAAGEEAGALPLPLLERGEAIEQRVDHLRLVGGGARIGAEPQIVDHAQFRKDLTALRHQDQPLPRDRDRRPLFDALAEEPHVAADRPDQSGERAHQRRLSRAVGAEHGDELALGDVRARRRGRSSRRRSRRRVS